MVSFDELLNQFNIFNNTVTSETLQNDIDKLKGTFQTEPKAFFIIEPAPSGKTIEAPISLLNRNKVKTFNTNLNLEIFKLEELQDFLKVQSPKPLTFTPLLSTPNGENSNLPLLLGIGAVLLLL